MTRAAPITGHLCIGGPLDGKIWPGDVPPTLPVHTDVPCIIPVETHHVVGPVIDRIHYVSRWMRPPRGEALVVFCDDRLTADQMRDVMNEKYPRGLT